jgi:hypothetical protein
MASSMSRAMKTRMSEDVVSRQLSAVSHQLSGCASAEASKLRVGADG